MALKPKHLDLTPPAPTGIEPGTLRVWWTPRTPGPTFRAIVQDVAQAKLLLNTLAEYDIFLIRHRIRTESHSLYVGGLEEFYDGEWLEWHDDHDRDITAVMASEAIIRG